MFRRWRFSSLKNARIETENLLKMEYAIYDLCYEKIYYKLVEHMMGPFNLLTVWTDPKSCTIVSSVLPIQFFTSKIATSLRMNAIVGLLVQDALFKF